jgi:hypothetical protein
METQKTDAGKDQRVVLNLNMAQAKQLKDFLTIGLISIENPEIVKICNRIAKTITKHENYGAAENLALLGTTRNPEAENGN